MITIHIVNSKTATEALSIVVSLAYKHSERSKTNDMDRRLLQNDSPSCSTDLTSHGIASAILYVVSISTRYWR